MLPADNWVILLLVLGCLLMLAELILPTAGILGAAGIIMLVVGIVIAFVNGGLSQGLTTLGLVGLFLLLVSIFVYYIWPLTPLGKRLILQAQPEDDSVATMPQNAELVGLIGRYGKAVSLLRPAGVVDFEGRRVDVITEGMMVEAGSWVKCVDVKAGKVIVRPAEPPRLDNLESAEFS